MENFDAIVVGSGPNGFSAAIVLAQKGLSVAIFEEKATIGGGTRTAELTLPGFKHDVCSAIHPLGMDSPFFKTLPLEKFGLEWIVPPIGLAHPVGKDKTALLKQSLHETAAMFGTDERAYLSLMEPLVKDWEKMVGNILAPLGIPRHPFKMAHFGLLAILPAYYYIKNKFETDLARCMMAGMAAHAMMPLENPITNSFGLVLGILGHTVGWPVPKGGSQSIAKALNDYFISLGGKVFTDTKITSLKDLPPSKAILFDLTPRQILKICGEEFTPSYRSKLEEYRYGAGVFKIDWALSEPVPYTDKRCLQAGTVHIGSSIDEIAQAEAEVFQGKHPEKPFVITAQQSLFDDTRAPKGKHTGWAYCHVPNGSDVDMTERIESQIEKFAPGFRDTILARHTHTAQKMEIYNSNYVGGDINGGIQDWKQLFTRPAARISPYTTSNPKIFICSSATPPGGGVHGMCGYHAAKQVLNNLF